MSDVRKVYRGHDGWYYNGEKTVATEEEMRAWNDLFCDYCCMGTIFSKDYDLKKQIPCPVCFGSGLKEGNYFKWFSDAKVDIGSEITLCPETFCPRVTIFANFKYNYCPQQDGRAPDPSYSRILKMYQLGQAILESMEKNKNYVV